MMESKSYVRMGIKKVVEACNYQIQDCLATRQRRDEAMISIELESLNKWAKIWPFKYWAKEHTREEAIKNLNAESFLYPSEYARDHVAVCRQVLKACENCTEDTILISTSDWGYITK